jgi:hypothetical protein
MTGLAVRKNGVLKNAYVPAIHVLSKIVEQGAWRDIGERSDAVLRTSMPSRDVEESTFDSDIFSGERRWIIL